MIARLNVGGATQQVCLVREELLHAFDTHLVAGRLAEGESDMSYLLSSEDNVFRLPEMSREISFSDAVAFWKILKFMRRVRPRIVHTHTAKAGALGRLAARMAGVPVIIHTYHGHVFYGYFNRFWTRVLVGLERFLGRFSTRIIAVSESQMQELSIKYKVVPCEKISVVPYGFDLGALGCYEREEVRRSLGLAADDFVVVWAGRLVPIKDVELLGRVIRQTVEKKLRIRFLIVGDGTERAKLESMLSGCSSARLLGWQQNMGRIWSAADVALLTSRNEGTPIALIEAMAAGVPFVATQVGGVRDIAAGPLRDLPDGFGVEAANGFVTARTPEALIYCLDLLARQPERARQMGAHGRSFAHERFSTSRMIADLTSLYNGLLSETQGSVLTHLQQSRQNESNAEDAI